jgi:hypothetical protein
LVVNARATSRLIQKFVVSNRRDRGTASTLIDEHSRSYVKVI